MIALDPVLVTPPSGDVVDLDTARAHLRVAGSDDDMLIAAQVAGLMAYLDGWGGILGRCLITQTWREDFSCWPGLRIPLRLKPVQSVTSINYYDSDGVQQTWPASNYRLHPLHGGHYVAVVDGVSLPSIAVRDDAVQITYLAGYGERTDDVPEDIRRAMLLLLGDLYENREETVIGTIVGQLRSYVSAMNLLGRYRRTGF